MPHVCAFRLRGHNKTMNTPLDDFNEGDGDERFDEERLGNFLGDFNEREVAGNPHADAPPEMTPEMQAAAEAFFATPFPRNPYALVPTDAGRASDFTDYIIHKDIETENQCVFVFDSIVDAFAVAEEYQQATGKEAEPVECDIYQLEEDRFWVKFYRANGLVAMLPLPVYKEHIGGAASPYED